MWKEITSCKKITKYFGKHEAVYFSIDEYLYSLYSEIEINGYTEEEFSGLCDRFRFAFFLHCTLTKEYTAKKFVNVLYEFLDLNGAIGVSYESFAKHFTLEK